MDPVTAALQAVNGITTAVAEVMKFLQTPEGQKSVAANRQAWDDFVGSLKKLGEVASSHAQQTATTNR